MRDVPDARTDATSRRNVTALTTLDAGGTAGPGTAADQLRRRNRLSVRHNDPGRATNSARRQPRHPPRRWSNTSRRALAARLSARRPAGTERQRGHGWGQSIKDLLGPTLPLAAQYIGERGRRVGTLLHRDQARSTSGWHGRMPRPPEGGIACSTTAGSASSVCWWWAPAPTSPWSCCSGSPANGPWRSQRL